MGPSRGDEADLLRRVAAGDEDAFSAFYREHLDAVVAFFARRVGDRELAFDLTAETFAAVVVGAGSYGEDAPPVAWLFGIARNKLRESLRRDRVAGRGPAAPGHGADRARRRRARTRRGTRRQRRERSPASARRAPPATRAALLARLVEEQEYGEIAARLQCSEQVVRQRVHRGLKALRANLREEA